ncbi:unnamed protein product [[Actinomadura] parvosata subsp. kistnae]|nr:unnamed protein product [Actinomadura parvosata subsp. kistnae]
MPDVTEGRETQRGSDGQADTGLELAKRDGTHPASLASVSLVK